MAAAGAAFAVAAIFLPATTYVLFSVAAASYT
jgi:hypothetical protein